MKINKICCDKCGEEVSYNNFFEIKMNRDYAVSSQDELFWRRFLNDRFLCGKCGEKIIRIIDKEFENKKKKPQSN